MIKADGTVRRSAGAGGVALLAPPGVERARAVSELPRSGIVILMAFGTALLARTARNDSPPTGGALPLDLLPIVLQLSRLRFQSTSSGEAGSWSGPELLVRKGRPVSEAVRRSSLAEVHVMDAGRERGTAATDQVEETLVLETRGSLTTMDGPCASASSPARSFARLLTSRGKGMDG